MSSISLAEIMGCTPCVGVLPSLNTFTPLELVVTYIPLA
jgi:hypothetical protein